MIYLIAFVLAVILFRLSIKYEDYKWISKVFLCLSALILILIATFRDETVGTDVRVYQMRFFSYAKNSSSFSDFVSKTKMSNDTFYLLITYFAAKFGNLNFLFFITESIIIVLIYKVIWFFRRNIYAEIILEMYLFFFYSNGLNIVRQSIAAAFLLYAFCMFVQEKYLYSALLYLIAVEFHISSFVLIVIVVLYQMSKSRISVIYQITTTILAIVLSLYYDSIFRFLVQYLTFLPKRYVSDRYLYRGNIDVSIISLLYSVFAFCIAAYAYKKNGDETEIVKTTSTIKNSEVSIGKLINSRFLINMMMLSVIGNIVVSKSRFAGRIFIYFDMFGIIVYPLLFECIDKKKRPFVYFAFLSIITACFVYRVIYGGCDEIYPYGFKVF